jgi:tRNA (adenine57-N1/adenine58-N1)-methyltransferase
MSLPRATQIVYPKDIGLILIKLSVVPGVRVVEAGSGIGILTTAFARYVKPGGHVYSYDALADMLEKAQANVRRAGLEGAVTFRQRTIEIGFEEDDADALFLDVREPHLYLAQAAAALCEGGFFGAIVPTINQVVELVGALARQPFTDVEILELLERHYKALPERIRPLDRLSAHTGFLVFARRLARRPAVREAQPGVDEPALGSDPIAD